MAARLGEDKTATFKEVLVPTAHGCETALCVGASCYLSLGVVRCGARNMTLLQSLLASYIIRERLGQKAAHTYADGMMRTWAVGMGEAVPNALHHQYTPGQRPPESPRKNSPVSIYLCARVSWPHTHILGP